MRLTPPLLLLVGLMGCGSESQPANPPDNETESPAQRAESEPTIEPESQAAAVAAIKKLDTKRPERPVTKGGTGAARDVDEHLPKTEAEIIEYVESLGGSVEYGDVYLSVDLGSLTISASNLRPLANLRRPFSLSLLESKFRDSDLRELLACEHLTDLILGSSSITDVAASGLASHKTLASVDLSGTKITNAALGELAKMQSLASVDLAGTKITNAALGELAKMQSLASLNLSATAITDAGIADLLACQKLAVLGLGQTSISDAALPQLVRFTKLRSINLRGTKMTDAGVEKLKQALPQCRINR